MQVVRFDVKISNGQKIMKKLDYTFSMLITIILSAIGTFFATMHYLQNQPQGGLFNNSGLSLSSESKPKPVGKQAGQVQSNSSQQSDGIGNLGRLAIELLYADQAINVLGKYLDTAQQYEQKLNRVNGQYELIRKAIDQLTKAYPDQASAIKVSHIQMQQQRVLALAEIDRLVQLYVHLRKINDVVPKAFAVSKNLADLLVERNADLKLVQLATYQLILLERIENALNRALRFNLSVKNPAIWLDRAQRDLAVFVTVVEGLINGNATQGIRALKSEAAKKMLAELKEFIPIFEFNLKPIVDNRLRIASTRKSIRQYNRSSRKLRKLILALSK